MSWKNQDSLDMDSLLDKVANELSRQAVKQGRRAAAVTKSSKGRLDESISQSTIIGDADEELIDSSIRSAPKSSRSEVAQPRPAMKGGWSDSRSKKRGDSMADDMDDDRRLRPRSPQQQDPDSDNDTPNIPELEDTQMKAGNQVTMAPLVAVNRVTTYKDLDNELLKHVAFLTLDNEIDLQLLSKGLSAESDLIEEDVPWEWDQLFTEVTSELQTEWDAQETLEDKLTSVKVQ